MLENRENIARKGTNIIPSELIKFWYQKKNQKSITGGFYVSDNYDQTKA